MNEAIARDWADILEGIPQDALHKACLAYLRTEPRRKPTPGAIYALAMQAMPQRPANLRVVSVEPPRPPPVTAERANEILREFNFRPKTFGGPVDE